MTNIDSIPFTVPALELFVSAGILKAGKSLPKHLILFEEQVNQVLGKIRLKVENNEINLDKAIEFRHLLLEICVRVMFHPIIESNNYLSRFSEGVTFNQARHELQQFSVFAINFDIAQTKLIANAPTQEAYEERLKVLLNEKGIPYKDGFEGELTGIWQPEHVHFSWLQKTAKGLNLHFEEIGKIWIANAGTSKFVDITFNTYASIDQNMSLGAAFAIENWAANNLWTPWIKGMRKLNKTLEKPISLGYLTYHEAEERHHSQATLDELLSNFLEPWFDAEKFFLGAETVLTEGVQVYYTSQLVTLPEKEGQKWPEMACEPRTIDSDLLSKKNLPKVA